MKRNHLIRHLRAHGCVLFREGANHSVFKNSATGAMSTVPRHTEVKNVLARKICRDLGIPPV